MARLALSVLGDLQARVGDRPVELGAVKQRAVLGMLLVASPALVTVEELTDELWGSAPPSDPRRNLQVYVSALRKALGAGGVRIEGDRDGYRLLPEDAVVDADGFAEAVGAARQRLEQGDPEAAAEAAAGALARWRGPAWQGLLGFRALAADAVRLEELRRQARVVLARARLELGQPHEALAELEPLLADEPDDEALHADLMLALHRAGRRDDALAHYRERRRRLVAETGLEPGRRLQDLHQAMLRDDPALVVEDPRLRARRHLPTPLTSLVGRQPDVEDLLGRLRTGSGRLVTVTGAGGIGKTRVALAAAHLAAADHPDGVWFVDLGGLEDPRLVPEAVAHTLDVEVGPDGAMPALRTHLGARRLLLVLDNLEQVLDAAPAVADLLAACPDLRVLATSRVPLRVYGEQVRSLEPLPAEHAVPLFVERARAVDHRFDPGPGDEVAAVCAALDHLPLALELVAARVDTVPLSRLRATLAETAGRLDLASEGPRDRSPRQQTLRNAIAWSVRLLEPGVAAAYHRLAVFRGGFDAEAATAVAGVGADRLEALVSASLLQRDAAGRFAMFQAVREHAEEDADPADLAATRAAHAAWYRRLAASSTGGMRGAAMATWVERLRSDGPDLRAAMTWWAETAEADSGAESAEGLLDMVAALGLFWYRTSPASADVEWLPRALRLGAGCDPALRARAWYALAICRAEQGRTEEALAHSRECRALLPADDLTWRARVLNTLGGIARDLGRPEEAAPMMEESIALRRRLQEPTLSLPIALANRAMVARDLGDLDRAEACLEECLRIARREDDRLDQAVAEAGLADVAVDRGQVQLARDLLARSVPVLRELGQEFRLTECLETLAALAVREDRAETAAALLAAADRALAEEGATLVPADRAMRERRVAPAVAGLDAPAAAEAARRGAALDLPAAIELGLTGVSGGG
ncbi:BTAD domain-containing putative transcriptional regulator [Nocardioides ferulae]|uniref:BTAD domain-containing putative transcriptional regulator n=1 Tax=Nocardioides ferulae TaxID=2340821 RepID=UPI000EAFD872|nr:BTAD domain-containing putative transcriptional regulator [Nocardioides ferulae]